MADENTCTCRGSVTAGDKSHRKRAFGELNNSQPCLKTPRTVVAIQIQRSAGYFVCVGVLCAQYRQRVIKSLDARRLCIVKLIFSDLRPCSQLLNELLFVCRSRAESVGDFSGIFRGTDFSRMWRITGFFFFREEYETSIIRLNLSGQIIREFLKRTGWGMIREICYAFVQFSARQIVKIREGKMKVWIIYYIYYIKTLIDDNYLIV